MAMTIRKAINRLERLAESAGVAGDFYSEVEDADKPEPKDPMKELMVMLQTLLDALVKVSTGGKKKPNDGVEEPTAESLKRYEAKFSESAQQAKDALRKQGKL